MNNNLHLYADADAVADAAAQYLRARLAATTGRFSLALSGGSTPQRLYRLLASPPWRAQIDWPRLHLFLADERFLPLDHADSNWRMVRETLLDALDGLLPPPNLHPMPTDAPVTDCAAAYTATLRTFFGGVPRFDLVILGMGPDGHTASLFPGHQHPAGAWVLPVYDSPKPPPTRLSLSLEVLNHADSVCFLVTGADKADALAAVTAARAPLLPAATVRPRNGELRWLVDNTAYHGAAA